MRFETVVEESYDVELAAQTDFVIDFAEDVKSITIGDTAISSYTVSGGKLTIPYATLSTITPNDYQMIIETESKSYETNIAIITKIIKTADDLIALQKTEDVTAYYVLGDNVTLTGTFAGITTGTFSGIFDGRGYAISGLNVSATGLLGVTAKNVVVKNVAFPNALYSGNTAGVIARNMSGDNSVENVFISFTCTGAWSRNVGSLCFELDGTLSIKNAVIYHANAYHYPNYPEFGTILASNKGTITAETVYAASDKQLETVYAGSATCTGVTNYTSLTAMQTAYTNDEIDISWAKDLGFYNALVGFLTPDE